MNSRTWKIRTARDLSTFAALLLCLASCTTDRTRRGYLEAAAAALDPPPRIAIVIPGFGVTRLYDPVAKRYVWGTARAAMHTRFEDDLDLPAGEHARDRLVPQGYVGSRGPVNTGWQLTEALRKYGRYTPGQTVIPFYYDWRRSARDNARELAQLADGLSPAAKVDLITHSAGALVALAWVKLDGGAGRVQNLVMVAPPLRGVVDAFRIFVRPERIMRRSFEPEAVATWPFVYELLPEDGRFMVGSDGQAIGFDGWSAGSWPEVGAKPLPESIVRARRFRDELAAAPMPEGVRVTILAGDCVPTTRAALYRKDGSFAFYPGELRPDERHLTRVLFEPGDGTVPWTSAAGDGVQFFCDGHQGIAADPNVHRAILRALERSR